MPGMGEAWSTRRTRVGKALLTIQGPEDLMPGQFLAGPRPVRNGAAGGVRAGEQHEARWEAGSKVDRMAVGERFPQEETSEQILEQISTFSPLLWIVEYVTLGFSFCNICIS